MRNLRKTDEPRLPSPRYLSRRPRSQPLYDDNMKRDICLMYIQYIISYPI